MKDMKKYRHELKYDINFSEYLALKACMSAIAKKDIHAGQGGTYRITSLYFDSYRDTALKEKIFGVDSREKFRIRMYDGDGSFIRLEKKAKKNNMCRKDSARLSKEQAQRIISGDTAFLAAEKDALLAEFYVKTKEKQLRPKTMVTYKREAYTYAPGNVRVTFDTDIRTGMYQTDIFNTETDIPAENPGLVILEIKYDEFLPGIIADAVQLGGVRIQAFSKYAECRKFE